MLIIIFQAQFTVNFNGPNNILQLGGTNQASTGQARLTNITENKEFSERFIKGDLRSDDECLTSIKIENLPSLDEIDRSHCMLAWTDDKGDRKYGTAFVGSIKDDRKNESKWLITAGHNFRNLDENTSQKVADCEIFFGNTLGFLSKDQLEKYNQENPNKSGNTQHVLLRDIVDEPSQPTYVWRWDGELEKSLLKIKGNDYAAFLLNPAKVEQYKLHGLLLCETTIDFIEDTPVSIFGHPKPREDWEFLPLRMSPGKLVEMQPLLVQKARITMQGKARITPHEVQHRVFYKNSTDTGNSGSPVLSPVGKYLFNTKYQVIGIHSGGTGSTDTDREKIFNYGHKMAGIVVEMKKKIQMLEEQRRQKIEGEGKVVTQTESSEKSIKEQEKQQ